MRKAIHKHLTFVDLKDMLEQTGKLYGDRPAYIFKTEEEKFREVTHKEFRDDIPVVIPSEKTIAGFTNGMEYSKDNGNSWISYNDDNTPTFKSGDVVLVRFSEDENYYASSWNKIEF